ncbi:MAG: PD-(D/E)XK nuclease family protein [Flavobacterium sp.]|jgi:hypothetical protein|nr:PD-(D/E)XK nuclease family protein [Flavobacterium sp.]
MFVEKLNQLFNDNNLNDLKLDDFGSLVNGKIVERYAGEVNYKEIKGGSIDIIIEDDKQLLIIENKIYASDQPLQLARYINYAKSRDNKKIVLLYLTLDGKNLMDKEGNLIIKDGEVYNVPTIWNSEENKVLLIDAKECISPISQATFNALELESKCLYTPISYHTFIKEWLEACFFFVDNRPMIYYPLKHYYNLIKKLTNQTTSKIMEKEIFEYLTKNKEHFKIATIIADKNFLGKQIIEAINQSLKSIDSKLKNSNEELLKLGLFSDSSKIKKLRWILFRV